MSEDKVYFIEFIERNGFRVVPNDEYFITFDVISNDVAYTLNFSNSLNPGFLNRLFKDKAATYKYLLDRDFSVPEGECFYEKKPDFLLEAEKFVAQKNQRLIVKPNASYGRKGISVIEKGCKSIEIEEALQKSLSYGRLALIQEFVFGIEVCIICSKDEILIAYEKHFEKPPKEINVSQYPLLQGIAKDFYRHSKSLLHSIDLVLDDETYWILDVNSNPTLRHCIKNLSKFRVDKFYSIILNNKISHYGSK